VGIFDKKVLMVTGKGGVGKTGWTAALGLAAARRDQRVLLAEADAAVRDLGDLFGRAEPLEMTPAEVPTEMIAEKNGRLWAARIDPHQVLREYVHLHVKVPFMAGAITRANLFDHIAEGTPGLRELMTLGQIWRWSLHKIPEAPEVDQLIFDGPATGHFRSLLRQPKALADLMKSGPLVEQGRKVRDLLEDPEKTGIVLIALPEELPINETLEFLQDPEMAPLVELVVVNAMVPSFFSPEESETVLKQCEGVKGSLPPDLEASRRMILRRQAQEALVAKLRAAWDGPVMEMPFSFAARKGPEGVAEMADRLERFHHG
jgi:anion-transporting  ArsA/GET3 family ATPase